MATVAPATAATVAPATAATVTPATAATVTPATAETVAPATAVTVTPATAATVAPATAVTVAPATATTVAPTPTFVLHDNVLVTVDNKTFLGQVVGVHDGGEYDVYFVDTGDVELIGVSDLRPERFPTPRRPEYLNLQFYFDGADDLPSGRWKVRKLEGNSYVCTRLTGGTASSTNIEKFDIDYVMQQVNVQHEFHRNSRSRRSSRF